MRLPRDLSGDQLAHALARLGYSVTRQTEGHLRLTTTGQAEHHITIPRTSPLMAGTVSEVLERLSRRTELRYERLLERLFPC